MPSQIQRPPWGLLDLIGAKSNGQNPNQLSDMVSATIELTPWELVGRSLDVVAVNAGATMRDSSASLKVPSNELWLIQQIGGFMNASAIAVVMGASLYYSTLDSGYNHTVYTNGVQIALANTSRVTLGWTPPQPLLLSSGASIGIRLNEDTTAAGQISMQVTVNYVRFLA